MNLKRRNTSSTDAVNHQRSLWLNKDGALLIRKAQEEERKKKEKEKVQRAARKVQTAMRKELATEAAQSGMQLVYEEPNEENYPIICARTNYRNYIAENDDATRWKCCVLCTHNQWFCGNKLCQNDGGNHIKKCVYNHKIIEGFGVL